MKFQCRHISNWGIRCNNNTVKGKDYCSKHLLPKKGDTFSIGKVEHNPTPPTRLEYNDYISSPEWKERSKEIRKKNPKCSLCNRVGALHVHHRTYVRLGNEEDGDLITLCKDCHDLFHQNYIYSSAQGHFIRR